VIYRTTIGEKKKSTGLKETEKYLGVKGNIKGQTLNLGHGLETELGRIKNVLSGVKQKLTRSWGDEKLGVPVIGSLRTTGMLGMVCMEGGQTDAS